MPKFNAETDHGTVVWAKMTKNSQSWPAIIISTKILDLVFEEKPDKIWVFWLGDNTFTHLKNYLVFNFCEDFAEHLGSPTSKELKNILCAIEIMSVQYDFVLPDEVTMLTNSKLRNWAESDLKTFTHNRLGKRKRNELNFIPYNIMDNIKEINLNNTQTLIQENIRNEIRDVNGQSRIANSKRKLTYCFSCRHCVINKDKLYSHPLFIGSICEMCRGKVVSVLLPIAEDQWNMECCICLEHDSEEKLILCEYCIRVYCENCVSIYNSKGSAHQIIKTNKWECFSCENMSSVNNKLLPRYTLDKQLQNVFNLFRGDICNSNKIKTLNRKPEVQVFALEDIQNNVSTVFKQLEHPFKLLEIPNLDNFSINDDIHVNGNTDETSHIKFIIKYYPNNEKYDKEKFDNCETIEMFLNFLFIRDRIALKYPNEIVFWAFETSAAIKYEEQQFISRFCGKKPILSTMYSENVQQRGRFIWSNVTICEKNVASFRKYNIFIQKMNRKDKGNPKPWCFDSVNLILTSLIENNIG